MSSDMKGWLSSCTCNRQIKSVFSVELVIRVVFYPCMEFTGWFAPGHIIIGGICLV